MNAAATPFPAEPSASPAPRLSAARAIVAAGLACGVLDICAAFTNAWLAAGVVPARVLRSVASALLGKAAHEGGAATAALGLAMHFFVAFCAATAFYAASRKLPVLLRHPIVSGLLYGVVVYLVMNLAVLPLAALFRSLYLPNVTVAFPKLAWIGLGIHLLFVGLPIALAVRKFSPASTSAAGVAK